MSNRTIGILIIVVGVLLVVASLAADLIGIGSGGGLGWKQLLGAGVGVLVVAAGVWWMGRGKKVNS